MFTTELTVMMPLILVILLMFMILCYFIAYLDLFELEVSSNFISKVLNTQMKPFQSETIDIMPVLHDDGYRLNYSTHSQRYVFYPLVVLKNDAVSFKSNQLFSKIKREWLLLANIVYEGGVGYFDDQR